MAGTFGFKQSILDPILAQRLRWSGRVGSMDGVRLTRKLLFAEVMKMPLHGARKRLWDTLSG